MNANSEFIKKLQNDLGILVAILDPWTEVQDNNCANCNI